MHLQLLHYFQCIARLGNFTKAALELHITQPALSKQMARLENEMGAELFIRTGRGIKLTEAGSRLLFHSERILADWEMAAQSIKDLGLSGRGYVRLAMYPTFMWYILPQFLPGFVQSNASIDFEIEQGLNETIMDWVIGHHMEAGIVTAPVSHPQLKQIPLLVEEFGLLMHTSHPWANRNYIPFEDLHQQPLILSTLNRWYESFILPLFKQLAIQPEVRLVVHQYDVIKELVRAELGVGLVPINAYQMWKKTERELGQELTIIPTHPTLQRQFVWIERHDRTRSTACHLFLEYINQYFNEG
jgi:DNA-binding transcriptional LysR family regulator